MKLLKKKDLKDKPEVLCIVTDSFSLANLLNGINTQKELDDFISEPYLCGPVIEKSKKRYYNFRYKVKGGNRYKFAFPVDQFNEAN